MEYEALGEAFGNRGKRSEEQIGVLRRLWTEPSVTFDGRYHRITGAGLAPLPPQRPIPLWIGSASDAGYRRVGRLADGWFPMMAPGPRLDHARAVLSEAAQDAGRDPSAIGMEGRACLHGDDDGALQEIGAWAQAGAFHLSINTMGAGLTTVDAHLDVLSRLSAALPAP